VKCQGSKRAAGSKKKDELKEPAEKAPLQQKTTERDIAGQKSPGWQRERVSYLLLGW